MTMTSSCSPPASTAARPQSHLLGAQASHAAALAAQLIDYHDFLSMISDHHAAALAAQLIVD